MKKNFLALLFLPLLFLPPVAHAAPVVLFDEAHGERFTSDKPGDLDLSTLAGILRDKGFEIRTAGAPLTVESLSGVTALVVSGPFRPFSPQEIDAVDTFVERGGRLAVMLHIAPPLQPLLESIGVDAAAGVITERENRLDDPKNFRVTSLEKHPLTAGVPDFATYGCWAVAPRGSNAVVVARSSARAWIDRDMDGWLTDSDLRGPFGIAVAGTRGSGRFVVFGDDAIFQNRFLTGNNLLLARNLTAWLQ